MRSSPSNSTDTEGGSGREVPSAGSASPVAGSAVEAEASPWLRIEVEHDALRHNMALFRQRVRRSARLLGVVKADGYGHGLLLAARAFLDGGADMLGVHALHEASRLRRGGVDAPILVLGPSTAAEVAEASQLGGVELTVGSLAGCRAAIAAADHGATCRLHLKVETGVYRQGLLPDELDTALDELAGAEGIALVGVSSDYADIEDTTDHGFAHAQTEQFEHCLARLQEKGHRDLCRHMSCSAAALLWSGSHRDLARVGISGYGIWPSRETLVSAREKGRNQLDLRPAMTWICRIAQVKPVPADQTVGYGRTWKAPIDGRLAVLPVGYSDGYPRALSNRAHVLVHGRRAPVRGRICMNLCMVDVSHIETARAGDDAVLLGRQEREMIAAEDLAELLGTIPYEVITLPGSTWRRIAV